MPSTHFDPIFTFIGGPTLLIEIGKVRLLTDPTFDRAGSSYVFGPVRLDKTADPAMTPLALPPIDAVLLTHDQHRDNLDDAGRAFLPRARHVLTTASGAARLGGNAVGLNPWQSQAVTSADGTQSIKVTATPARHGPPGCEPVMGDVIGFCVEAEGLGGAIYFSGDTVWFEGVEEVARQFRVETAVLFLGAATVAARGPDHLTMTADEAVRAATALAATYVVPVHYEGWAHFREGRADVTRAFQSAGLEQKLRWLQPGRRTSLTGPADVRTDVP
jgi:L-ascorbate metabolism protein UlaG (beta-lactamase superfamily)